MFALACIFTTCSTYVCSQDSLHVCADVARTGLVHVRFTFDRTPFRRMLRALHHAGHQQRSMQLLPPQTPSPSSLAGTILA